MSGLARAWEGFWHRPDSARNMAAARVLLAGTALWVVLSRYDLPSVLELPPELWSGVSFERRLRFLIVLGPTVERVLYGALHVVLAGAIFGPFPRAFSFTSGLLLYHFAPFETIIRSPNPYLRGLTLPTLGLLLLSFAPPAASRGPVPGWPRRLVQVLFCQIYLFAGYSKLFTSGLGWMTADNLRGHLLVLNQALGVPATGSLGYALAAHPILCLLLGVGGVLFELAFPLVLFSQAARLVLVPLAAVFHLANAAAFHVTFPNFPLLLLFVDWDGVVGRWRP